MATFSGKAGLIEDGSANAVAEVVDWSVTITNEPMEDTALADDWSTFVSDGGNRAWSGQITCRWDDTDTTGQTALESALMGDTDFAVNLLPEGTAVGAYEISGNIRITNMDINISRDDPVARTFSFTGNGAPTIGTN